MSTLTGTGKLVRLILRRDRVLMLLWIVFIGVVPISYASTFATLYPTAAARQPFAGIHISILISEAGLGFSVAVTRQNEGRPWIGIPPPGGVNVPETVAAEVMARCGNAVSEAFVMRSEHVSAAAVPAPRKIMAIAR